MAKEKSKNLDKAKKEIKKEEVKKDAETEKKENEGTIRGYGWGPI